MSADDDDDDDKGEDEGLYGVSWMGVLTRQPCHSYSKKIFKTKCAAFNLCILER